MRRTTPALLMMLVLACVVTIAGGTGAPAQSRSAGAQDPAPPATGARSVFRSGTVLVTMGVFVTDREHRFVDGLAARDFAVFEDGVRQAVTFFAADRVPIDLAILLDLSSSMRDALTTTRAAATRLIESLQAGDRVMVAGIRDSIDMLHPLNDDYASAARAIQRAIPGGATALYNGVYLALTEMARKRPVEIDVRRQAIVLLSDGADTASLLQYDDVLQRARTSGIVIYTIAANVPEAAIPVQSPRHQPHALQPQFVMRSLALETGGRSFFPTIAGELENAYDVITEELAHQYTLAYVPKDLRRTTAVRRLAVRVVDRPDLVARTRTSYSSAR